VIGRAIEQGVELFRTFDFLDARRATSWCSSAMETTRRSWIAAEA
jgi:hypothetical protein